MTNFNSINDEITAFNHMYDGYITCSNTNLLCTEFNHYNNGVNMTKADFENIVDTAYANLIDNIKGIHNSSGIDGSAVFANAASNYNAGMRSSEYDNNYTDMLSKNLNNVKRRNNLESQIKELKQSEGSIYAENKQINDFTIYTNIILTTMITCGMFIIFSNL